MRSLYNMFTDLFSFTVGTVELCLRIDYLMFERKI